MKNIHRAADERISRLSRLQQDVLLFLVVVGVLVIGGGAISSFEFAAASDRCNILHVELTSAKAALLLQTTLPTAQ